MYKLNSNLWRKTNLVNIVTSMSANLFKTAETYDASPQWNNQHGFHLDQNDKKKWGHCGTRKIEHWEGPDIFMFYFTILPFLHNDLAGSRKFILTRFCGLFDIDSNGKPWKSCSNLYACGPIKYRESNVDWKKFVLFDCHCLF